VSFSSNDSEKLFSVPYISFDEGITYINYYNFSGNTSSGNCSGCNASWNQSYADGLYVPYVGATKKSPFDIISITPNPEPKRIQGWLNIYSWGLGSLRDTREEADGQIGANERIACIPIDVAEGEGL
jgi:hypothetical protein